MEKKHVLFLAHGIGRHASDWSAELIDGLKETAGSLPADPATGFDPARLLEAIDATSFVPLWYDDLYAEAAQRMLERPEALITGLQAAGLGTLARLFRLKEDDATALETHIFDVIIYRAMREYRYCTRKHVTVQMLRAMQKHGVGAGVEYSVMAHSLGTAVMHDTLHELATERGSPYQLGSSFRVHNLFMIANTSALLRNDYDPRASLVRPLIGEFDPGYVDFYFDFAHRWDPVAQLYSYRRYMKNYDAARCVYVTTDGFRQANIHAYSHYLTDPRVYGWVLGALYGDRLVPIPFRQKLLDEAVKDTIDPGLRERIIEKLRHLVDSPLGEDAEGRSEALLRIAKFLKEQS